MSVTINKTITRFKDLNLLFTRHPITDDVTVKTDVEAVKFSIKNLILTRHFEVPFHPEVGTSIVGRLFENYTPVTRNLIEEEIRNVITNYEPRAELLGVNFSGSPMKNSMTIEVVFRMINVTEPITLSIVLERTR